MCKVATFAKRNVILYVLKLIRTYGSQRKREEILAKIGKEYKQIAATFLGCTLASYYNWANDKRLVIAFIEKYFTKEDLEEFLETGTIQELDDYKEFKDSKEYNLFKDFLEFKKYKGE